MSPREHHFLYHGVELPYVYHLYNLTHLNERMVELAIARHFIDRDLERQHDGVEVGNVLGHYEPRMHTVIDLYEGASFHQVTRGQQVINADVTYVSQSYRAPWVASISTVEHTANPMRTIDRLMTMVEPGGRLLVTFPTGERAELDTFVGNGFPGPWARACTLSREGDPLAGGVEWRQDPEPRVNAYGPWANTVAVIEWENK